MDSKVKREVDVNSDYYMVKIRIRLCFNVFKIKSKLRLRLDVECFKNMEFIKKSIMIVWEKNLVKLNLKKRRMRIWENFRIIKDSFCKFSWCNFSLYEGKSKFWISEDKWKLKDGRKEIKNRLYKIW